MGAAGQTEHRAGDRDGRRRGAVEIGEAGAPGAHRCGLQGEATQRERTRPGCRTPSSPKIYYAKNMRGERCCVVLARRSAKPRCAALESRAAARLCAGPHHNFSHLIKALLCVRSRFKTSRHASSNVSQAPGFSPNVAAQLTHTEETLLRGQAALAQSPAPSHVGTTIVAPSRPRSGIRRRLGKSRRSSAKAPLPGSLIVGPRRRPGFAN